MEILKKECQPNEVCIETVSILNNVLGNVWPIIKSEENLKYERYIM